MADFFDFFLGGRFAVWEEAIADILQAFEDQREATLNAIYLSTALITELSDHYGILVGTKPDPTWQLEVFREHLQEVIQAYLMLSSTRAGVEQTVAATTQMPPILRPIQLLQRWLLGFQYLPNRFYRDLDGFVFATVDGPYTLTDTNNLLVLKINGVSQLILLPTGDAVTAAEVITSINAQAIGAVAFPFGKRFGLETIERDPGGSVQVEVPSTADTLFGLDNFVHNNSSPPPGGTGTLPFGWRLSGDYLAVPLEADPPTGTDSQPVSFDGALFGVDPVIVRGANVSPFVGLLSPVFLFNGGFEQGFKEWDKTDGPEFFITAAKSRTGSQSLAVVTRTQIVIDPDGRKRIVPVLNTITTARKFIPAGSHLFVQGYNQAATPGEVYQSPAAPPSTFEWVASNAVFGYMDQQFSKDPQVADPDVPTAVLTDPSVDFVAQNVKPGMAVHVVSGPYVFDGVVKGVETHRLFVDQWRNGPTGGPTAAYIRDAAAAGSGVTYTPVSAQDPAKDFTALGVQAGATYQTRDKIRVDETISHFGQITTERQLVRDIEAISTTTNPNDTLTVSGGWGQAPTPLTATLSVSGSPYAIYIRPPDGVQYAVFHSLNEVPAFAPDFAHISANFLYELRFYGFDGSLMQTSHHQFRPAPGSAYEAAAFTITVPRGAQTAQVAITVGPDEKISEPLTVDFEVPPVLTQALTGDDALVRIRDGLVLIRGGLTLGDYAVDPETNAIVFLPAGPANLQPGESVEATYSFQPQGGALVSIDDVVFRCVEEDIRTAFHAAVDQIMQKVVFDTGLVPASGTITYTAVPVDADTITIGDETYEFDVGSYDQGTVTYTGQPNDGDTITIGGLVFEFDTDCVIGPGNVQVFIDGTDDLTFTNLTTAINHMSSLVHATIDTGTNVVTVKATNAGVTFPAISFTMVGANYSLLPGGGFLTGGGAPAVTPGNVVVPITAASLDQNYITLVEAINSHSTSVFSAIDTGTSTVTVKALALGFQGNDIEFTAVVPDVAFVLSPALGHLEGATALHAGAEVVYTGQPNDGDTITIGTNVYEFDSDAAVTGTNQPIQIGVTADATWALLAQYVTGDNNAVAAFENGRVTFTAVVAGPSGNALVFLLSAANATAYPATGTFTGGVSSSFADVTAPTCTEVASYLNTRLTGVTASCDPPDLGDPNNGYLVLTSDTDGFKSAVVVGHGSANTVLGMTNDAGKRNSEDAVQPGWRITSGTPGDQLVAISRGLHPTNLFFNTEWHGRIWITSTNPAVKAHVLMFFEDANGNMTPSIGGEDGAGTISTLGTAVTGVSTQFTTQLVIGSLILAAKQLRRVVAIADDLNLTVDAAYSPDLSAEEYIFQNPVTLSTTPQPVETYAKDYGRFTNVDMKVLLNGVANGDVIDIAFGLLTNEISKSLHLNDNTIPRNKQREHKMYRMAVASPDEFTDIESGLVGSNKRVDQESVSLVGSDFAGLTNQNLFPSSEIVEQTGIHAFGTIQYTGQPADGDTLSIGTSVYEFDNNSVVAGGHLPVTIGATDDDTFANLVTEILATSAFVDATQNAAKKTVTVTALLAGAGGNSIIFAPSCSVVRLTPIIGTLDGGTDPVGYTRDVDYTVRYPQGEIARLPHGAIPDPSPTDLAVTYSFFPGGIPLNESYPQTIKPVGVKLEIDPTCLFFFRGRYVDFTHPEAFNQNFEVVLRSPSRFTYLKPVTRGRYAQVVHPSATPEFDGSHEAVLDYTAMVDQEAILIKTIDGVSTAIPQDSATNGWFFPNATAMRISPADFDPSAEYEFVYFVQFQFITAPITIADLSSGYALLPYAYRMRQVDELKEDVEQTLILDTATRRTTLRLPAITDQALAEVSRTLGGTTDVISDELWGFVDDTTVEIFLGAYDPAAIFTITYKSSKMQVSTPVNELYEVALSDDGITFGAYAAFEPGEVVTLAKYVKFRLTAWGDFDVDDYRLRGFGGIVDDATINIGGFGVSPFGRFPFGDGGVCLADTASETLGALALSGSLSARLLFHPVSLSGGLGLSGVLGAVVTPPVGGPTNVIIFNVFDNGSYPYIGLDGSLAFTTGTPADVQTTFPVSATITDLDIIAPDPGIGNSITYKINVNGSDDPGLTLTLSGGSTTASASGTVSITAGDLVCISVSTTGTPVVGSSTFSLGYA